MTDREKIASGECVSPLTVDRCPYCVDKCEASKAKQVLQEADEVINGPLEKTVVDGESILHRDVIYHTIKFKLSFWSRVRVLFGGEITTHSEIFTRNKQVDVVTSRARHFSTAPFRIRWRKQEGMMHVPNQEPQDIKTHEYDDNTDKG